MSDESPTPRLFDHALRVYEEMKKRSHKERIRADDASEDVQWPEVDVYEGHLTTLFSDLQIANPYYTRIKQALVAQGCIQQLRRGGGAALSKWILLYPPTEDGFREAMNRRSQTKGLSAQLAQQVRDLSRTLTNLYGTVEDQDIRIQNLERKMEALKR